MIKRLAYHDIVATILSGEKKYWRELNSKEEYEDLTKNKLQLPLNPETIQSTLESLTEDGFIYSTLGLKKYYLQAQRLEELWNWYLEDNGNSEKSDKNLSDIIPHEEIGEWIFDTNLNITNMDHNVNVAILIRKLFFILWKLDEKLKGQLNLKQHDNDKTLTDYNYEFNQIVNTMVI